jgi:phosphoserine phosphatase
MLKLAVFDLDGTLKPRRDPYTYLHEHLGVADQAKALTARGLAGELGYEEWLRGDAALWRGTTRARLEQLMRALPYTPGARETIAALKQRGIEIVIISAGLLFHAELVARDLGISRYVANEIIFEKNGDGIPVVTGAVVAAVSFDNKGTLLEAMQAELGIGPEATLAVGDMRSDIPLFERAAVGVAVQPHSDAVAEAADIVLPEPDLRPLLTRLHTHAPHLWP